MQVPTFSPTHCAYPTYLECPHRRLMHAEEELRRLREETNMEHETQ